MTMPQPEAGGSPRSARTKWFVGCSVAVAVLGFTCVGFAWWGVRAAEDWAARFVHEALTETIEEAHLPEDQAKSMYADLERARLAVESGQLGWRDLERLEDVEVELERLVSLGVIQWFAAAVVPDVTGLSDEEKADADRTLQRLGRAVQEGHLHSREAAAPIDVQLEIKGEDGLDAEDVRIVVAKVRRIVDDLGIPDEPFQVDVASEFTKIVDRLLE